MPCGVPDLRAGLLEAALGLLAAECRTPESRTRRSGACWRGRRNHYEYDALRESDSHLPVRKGFRSTRRALAATHCRRCPCGHKNRSPPLSPPVSRKRVARDRSNAVMLRPCWLSCEGILQVQVENLLLRVLTSGQRTSWLLGPVTQLCRLVPMIRERYALLVRFCVSGPGGGRLVALAGWALHARARGPRGLPARLRPGWTGGPGVSAGRVMDGLISGQGPRSRKEQARG